MLIGKDYTLVTFLGETGLTEIALEYKKPEETTFGEISLEEGDFVEAEHGYYNFLVRKELIDQVGTYVFKLSGYELDLFEERECLPVPLNSSPPPSVCVITGNIRNASAKTDAFKGVAVTAKPLKLPHEIGGTFTLGARVATYTDHSGFFQLPLIIGMTALIEIRDVGVRFQAVIPDQETVRIEDIMP